MISRRLRIAFVVSHPIQYFAPLYQRLAQRDDVSIKVFFTWHAGQVPVVDSGFRVPIAWDIPLTEGYEYELVPNQSSSPGTRHFLGLRNRGLVQSVAAWRPDIVHVTGWAWLSHLKALHAFSKLRIPTLFRGDSHLLDGKLRGPRWALKHAVLTRVFSWPTAFLVVGSANRAYYRSFGVGADRLFDCPHSIDVDRFAEPRAALETKAAVLRRELGVPEAARVFLYAAKFDPGKRPLQLMEAVCGIDDPMVVLILVGSGELEREIHALSKRHPGRFFILPFQNQSRMPVVYRLGDLFVFPSSSETWGLAVNEAMACGRPVLVSDRVGCAQDIVDNTCGRIFSWDSPDSLGDSLKAMASERDLLERMGKLAGERAKNFDVARTEETLLHAAWTCAA